MKQMQRVCVIAYVKDCYDRFAFVSLFWGAVFFRCLILCCYLLLGHHVLGRAEHLDTYLRPSRN